MTDQPETTAPPGETSNILPGQHWLDLQQNQPAHEDDDDGDSAIADVASSTASMSSSILEYRTIHGRTFHSSRGGDSQYWAPNDDTQNESLDIIHHVLTLMLDGNIYRAPLGKNIENVVDIGTGTGIWAIDFADKYPDAKVIGTDLSPIQPSWVPPNIDFQIDDCTQPWTFEENSLDYVHIRWLFGSIKDWTELFKQAYRCLKPGGWLETHEASVQFSSDDGSVHDKTAMGQFGSLFIEGGKKMGRWMTIIEDGVQRKSVEEANFVNIHEEDFKTPIGTWPKDRKQKEIGSFQQLAVEQDTEGSLIYIAGLQGWTQEEVRVYIKHLKKEFRDPAIHGYYKQKIVWAQKPAE